MSKIVAVVLLLLEACDALLVTPHSSHALLRTDGRCSAPLLLASKRKKRGKKSERSGASRPEAPQQYAPPDSPPPRAAAPVPSVPPPQWEPPPTPLVATPGSFSDAAPPAAEEVQPLPLPAVDDYLVSQVRDEPKQALPSFDSYSRGGAASPRPFGPWWLSLQARVVHRPHLAPPSAWRSAQEAAAAGLLGAVREQAAFDQSGRGLPAASEGGEASLREADLSRHLGAPRGCRTPSPLRPACTPQSPHAPPVLTRAAPRGASAQAGIIILVAIEIFINTPAFQSVKPAILRFLGSD